jgi:hypothetical protein
MAAQLLATAAFRPSRGRWSVRTGLALLVATAGIGLMHTPWGRPLLMGLGGCPAARVSPADVERLRVSGFHAVAGQGTLRAPARPALGFQLDQSTPDDVRAWAARAGVACEARERGLLSLRCHQVPRDRLPEAPAASGRPGEPGASSTAIEELALTFAPSGRLISVDAFTPRLPASGAAVSFGAATARLQTQLGPPSDQIGDATAAALERVPLATARARYRFDDYVAIISASNLASGIAVREQYLSGG